MRIFGQCLIDTFCFILFLIPRRLIRFLGSLLGVLWFDILRLRRKVIFSNLDIAFPEMPYEEKLRIARTSTYRMGADFLEVFTIPQLTQKWLEKNVVFEGREFLAKAQRRNKGVYLLGMHLGNGDLTASSIAMKGENLYLITKFFKNPVVNDLWFHVREAQGVKFIEPHGTKTAFDILKAIKEKACVAFVLDQFMGRPYALETTFFGRKTGTAYGLALFYLKTGSPVVPVYSFEGQDGRYHVVYEPELDLDALLTENKDENLLKLTQHFNDVIERAIRKHPEAWMWVHRRWKEYE